MEVTNCRAHLMLASQEGIHIWYCRPSQEPVAGEVTSSRGKATAVVLLNERDMSVEFPSKVTFIYVHTLILLIVLVSEANFPPPGSLY